MKALARSPKDMRLYHIRSYEATPYYMKVMIKIMVYIVIRKLALASCGPCTQQGASVADLRYKGTTP